MLWVGDDRDLESVALVREAGGAGAGDGYNPMAAVASTG